jgi:catechol 2,3-dioxygenase-like lactoylglutathione lyase family enzyme
MSLATSAVAVMLPVDDVDRAKKFYVESLGLDCTGTDAEGSAMFELGGGATLVLLPRPGGQHSDSTALSWAVDDVADQVAALEQKGVVFQDFDGPDLMTVDHVATMGGDTAAWFADPDGNVLCIHHSSS